MTDRLGSKHKKLTKQINSILKSTKTGKHRNTSPVVVEIHKTCTQSTLKIIVVVNVRVRANVVKVVVVIALSFETLGDPLRRRASVKPLTNWLTSMSFSSSPLCLAVHAGPRNGAILSPHARVDCWGRAS